jgi:hypothetical protein
MQNKFPSFPTSLLLLFFSLAIASAAEEDFEQFGIYARTAPRPARARPIVTKLPLQLHKGERIALIGNTLLERSQEFGIF